LNGIEDKTHLLPQKVFQDPIYFIGFGFGTGLLPMAPGTWGTLAALPIYLLLAKWPWFVYISVTALLFLLGVWASDKISKDLGVHDHSGIVWDEVAGYLFTMFLVPFHWFWIILGFVLFRLFDIWKPQPIKWVDKHVQGGLGIMLDDVLAAIPAWLLLQLACLLFYGSGTR
jgi:phosphatidylglycerophosphatase A